MKLWKNIIALLICVLLAIFVFGASLKDVLLGFAIIVAIPLAIFLIFLIPPVSRYVDEFVKRDRHKRCRERRMMFENQKAWEDLNRDFIDSENRRIEREIDRDKYGVYDDEEEMYDAAVGGASGWWLSHNNSDCGNDCSS